MYIWGKISFKEYTTTVFLQISMLLGIQNILHLLFHDCVPVDIYVTRYLEHPLPPVPRLCFCRYLCYQVSRTSSTFLFTTVFLQISMLLGIQNILLLLFHDCVPVDIYVTRYLEHFSPPCPRLCSCRYPCYYVSRTSFTSCSMTVFLQISMLLCIYTILHLLFHDCVPVDIYITRYLGHPSPPFLRLCSCRYLCYQVSRTSFTSCSTTVFLQRYMLLCIQNILHLLFHDCVPVNIYVTRYLEHPSPPVP